MKERKRRKKKIKRKEEKNKKKDFKDFALSEMKELKFTAIFFIILAVIMNPRGGYIDGSFEWDLFLIALSFIIFFFILGAYFQFRSWIRYLKDED